MVSTQQCARNESKVNSDENLFTLWLYHCACWWPSVNKTGASLYWILDNSTRFAKGKCKDFSLIGQIPVKKLEKRIQTYILHKYYNECYCYVKQKQILSWRYAYVDKHLFIQPLSVNDTCSVLKVPCQNGINQKQRTELKLMFFGHYFTYRLGDDIAGIIEIAYLLYAKLFAFWISFFLFLYFVLNVIKSLMVTKINCAERGKAPLTARW